MHLVFSYLVSQYRGLVRQEDWYIISKPNTLYRFKLIGWSAPPDYPVQIEGVEILLVQATKPGSSRPLTFNGLKLEEQN
jgi:hypothetical protein